MNPLDRSTKEVAEDQEKMVANYLGWKRVTGSGARPGYPGDVEGENWLGECKTHMVPGKPVKFDFNVWEKIANEAASRFKRPVLFADNGMQDSESTWVMFIPDNIHLFTENVIECHNDVSYSASLTKLEEYYDDSPYIWMVLKHKNDAFAIMPLSEFKKYADGV